MRTSAWILAALSAAATVTADIKLPTVSADHMVLQRETSATFWGWANPNEKINVTGSWGETVSTITGKDSKWKVALKTPEAGGPFTVTVKGDNTIAFKDVLIGEVWLCSGQSNMGMTVSGVINGTEEIAAANYPQIRLLGVNLVTIVALASGASWS